MEKLKLSACGVNCNECGQYKVTVEKDIKSAEALVGWFRSMGWIGENEGAEAVMKKSPLCKGCWNTTDDCFWKCGCGTIDFRICCIEKQISHCGECGEFPCGHYIKWIDNLNHHKKAMVYLLSLRTNT